MMNNDKAYENKPGMMSRIRQIFRTDLIRVSFMNGIATVVRMFTGLVSVKVVAAVIGPTGIALLGQLTNFSQIILSISNGGINAGITKYVAEYSDDRQKYKEFIGTAFRITIVLSAITSIILILGAGYFSTSILHDSGYRTVFYVFGGTLMLYALNALLVAVINGFKEYRKYVIANILGSVTGMVFSIVLALTLGVFGALLAAVTFQSIVFFLTLLVVRKCVWFRWDILSAGFRKSAGLRLSQFSLMALVSAITVPAAQLIVRNLITGSHSIVDAGLWEGVNRISTMYLAVITTSLSVYYLPRMSELKEQKDLQAELHRVYKVIIPFLLVSTSLIFVFRNLIIRLLFTKEFAGMESLFAFQLVGDILKIAGWVLGYLLIAKAMSRIYILMEVANFVLLVGFTYFLVPIGAIGATMAYAAVSFIYLVVLAFVFRNLLFRKQN